MIEKLFKKRTDNTLIQLFRYTFVGGAAFMVDFTTLFILTEFFKVYYLISAGIAFLFGVIVNYSLSISWIFNTRRFKNKWIEFGIFAFVGVVGLGLNEIFIWFFTEHVHFYYLISKLVSTAFVYLWNFFARKYILFR